RAPACRSGEARRLDRLGEGRDRDEPAAGAGYGGRPQARRFAQPDGRRASMVAVNGRAPLASRIASRLNGLRRTLLPCVFRGKDKGWSKVDAKAGREKAGPRSVRSDGAARVCGAAGPAPAM